MKFHCHRCTRENIVESHKRPLKKSTRKIGYIKSEVDNCAILHEDNEDEDLEDFDQLNENKCEEMDRFPKVD